ncbi:hypothetical protein P7K49_028176 [Saguinus oedipus]|uniref:Uncharacterized protein n=1 Tax=Saguinus oedipus TaxID=9490 RepID=A0ABQ9UBG7_SAGOE|nr:hypothetical protein P7K49_028176 [Saguinus oedipus]
MATDKWKMLEEVLNSVVFPESSPGVTEVTIIEKPPAERHMISSWEQYTVSLGSGL